MKITCLRFLMVILMSCLLSSAGIGQDFALIENEGTPGPKPCNGTEIVIYVKVANLGLLHHSDERMLPLPEGYPAMYCRYTIGNMDPVIVEITEFYYRNAELDNGVRIYSARFTAEQLSDLESDHLTNGTDDNFTVNYTLELLTFDGTNYHPYPICNYTAPGDIFACNAFSATAPYCVSTGNGHDIGDGATCSSLELSVYTGSFEYYGSGDCDPDPEVGLRNSITDEDDLSGVSVSPNPFQNLLQINWPKAGEGTQELQLSDINGRIVAQRMIAPNASDLINISTEALAPGIYFLRLSAGQSSKVLKLVKQ